MNLIGIKKHIVEQYFDVVCHELLQSQYVSQAAAIIRYLCKLRNPLFLRYKKTDNEIKGGNLRVEVRTCVHRILHVSFRQILPIAALKKLTIRQYAFSFSPCSR